jgi:hypothetical protein
MFQFSDTGGLFEKFEINADPFWPKVSKVIGGSVIFHVLLIVAITLIPPVRDALSLALVFSGGLVDRPYTKTHIENEGDITEITTEKFQYPEGYFAMDQMGMPTPTPTPAFAAAPPPFIPKSVPPAQLEASPSPSASASPVVANKATPTPTPDAEQDAAAKKAEEELDRIAKESGIDRPKEINTRPFKDLLVNAKKMKDAKTLNLDGLIELTVEADRDEQGKLTNAKVTDKRGDKTLEGVALDFIAALSDSGALDFLKGTKHLKVFVKLDNDNVEVTATTEVDSEDRARQLERTFGGMIVLGRIVKHGKDEEIYYNHTQVSSHEKEVDVKFAITRAEMSALLTKYANEK